MAKKTKSTGLKRRFVRITPWTYLGVLILLYLAFILHLPEKNTANIFTEKLDFIPANTTKETMAIAVFPVGVDPTSKTIEERAGVSDFLETEINSNHFSRNSSGGWLQKIQAQLAMWEWYQNLASPTGRIIVIQSGHKKEQIASNVSKIMGWNNEQKAEFVAAVGEILPEAEEGMFYPGKYTVARNASPQQVADLIVTAFYSNIIARYPNSLSEELPLSEILTLASLLEREGYDFEDMRYISGIIWNRLFIDMRLQLDATLQYAKAKENGWESWPVPRPADKYIESPYNTYKYNGLPPGPIANPSVDAVLAALNPRQTDCIFYFHDTRGKLYCNKTYEGHTQDIREVYGS